MSKPGEERVEVGAAMQAVLEAEAQAVEAVKAAHQLATDMLATAQRRARIIEAIGEARNARIRASDQVARQAIRKKFQREADMRLAQLAGAREMDDTAVTGVVLQLAGWLIGKS